MKKRIAIVYHYLAYYRLPIFKQLCEDNEFIFTLISDKESNFGIKTIDEKIAYYKPENGGLRWLFVKNFWLVKEKLLWQRGILRMCLSNNFDGYIFLGNAYYISTWISALILKFRNKPTYFWTHGIREKEKGIKGSIRKNFYKIPNGLLLYGNYAKKLLINQGFDAKKLHVIFNSLDYKTHLQLRNSLSYEELKNYRKPFFKDFELPQLIFIGRLIPQKKLHQLIEALYILCNSGIQMNLLIVGEGKEKKSLINLIKEYKISEHVFFKGESYDEEENYKLIASSDLCVSPGEIGLTAIHSLSYGIPIITHNNFKEQGPEFEAIEPGFTGDFFEQDNIIDLVQKIQNWLINHPVKTDLLQNCYKIIDSKYNPEYQREVICKIFRDETYN
jgi:glycosyltransferase involved in cell wall biosynthesis